MKDVFSSNGNRIICNIDLEFIIEKTNYEITPEGYLDCFLFGALIMYRDGGRVEVKTMTLGTRCIIPIYSNDQIVEENDHIIVSFKKGDIFINNRFVPKTIDNVAHMFDLLTSGHLSNRVPYYKYYDIVMNNLKTNEMLSFPKVLLELMLAEMFINEKGEKLRLTGSDYGISASIDDVVQTAGAFNSMIFADHNKSILINKGKTKEEQKKESKLEEFFKK